MKGIRSLLPAARNASELTKLLTLIPNNKFKHPIGAFNPKPNTLNTGNSPSITINSHYLEIYNFRNNRTSSIKTYSDFPDYFRSENSSPNSVVESHKDRTLTAQSNLKILGYYEGNIDGLSGPLTEKAIKRFENDYALTGIGYDFQVSVDNKIVRLEIKKGEDFLEYWDSRRNRIRIKCHPSICLSKDKIAISIDCNGQTIGITTKGEITLTATNGQYTFEKTFNEATPNPSCTIDWKLCISKIPSGEISVCNLTLSASGNSQLNLSAKNGNRSISISLL